MNGNQFFGNSNATAEFGHMVIAPEGERCNCGKRGCLEKYISTNVLSENLNISLEDFFSSLEKGNNVYRKIFDTYLTSLCIGISNIRLVLGLEVVVADEITEYLSPYEALIQKKIRKMNKFENKQYFRFSKNKKENSSSTAAALKTITIYIENFINTINNYSE